MNWAISVIFEARKNEVNPIEDGMVIGKEFVP